MRSIVFYLFFVTTASLGFVMDAQACGCATPFHPCFSYGTASVIFVGRVTEVGSLTPVAGSNGKVFTMNGRVTKFAVEEAFRGVEGDTAETFERGTSCDYGFKPGERYFVYGSRDPKTGKTYVFSCSGTKSFEYAADDIAYARSISRGERTPSLVGYVNRETRESAAAYRSHTSLEGIKVVAEGVGKPVKVNTDARGRFEFFGLRAGKYSVRAETPSELRRLYKPPTDNTEVVPNRCSGAGFTVTSLSTISGKIINADGVPVKVKVNLVPVDESGAELSIAEGSTETYTNDKGEYTFDWLAPGRYLVAINPRNQPGSYDPPFPRTYLPGVSDKAKASVVEVAEGEQLAVEEFRLPPPLVEAMIEGVALFPDGRPAANALINLEFTDREWFETNSADAQGRFSLKVFDGFKYQVAGEHRWEQQGKWVGVHSPPVEVVAGAAREPIKLTISQPGFYEPRYARRRRGVRP